MVGPQMMRNPLVRLEKHYPKKVYKVSFASLHVPECVRATVVLTSAAMFAKIFTLLALALGVQAVARTSPPCGAKVVAQAGGHYASVSFL
jgi:hypothetical protein